MYVPSLKNSSLHCGSSGSITGPRTVSKRLYCVRIEFSCAIESCWRVNDLYGYTHDLIPGRSRPHMVDIGHAKQIQSTSTDETFDTHVMCAPSSIRQVPVSIGKSLSLSASSHLLKFPIFRSQRLFPNSQLLPLPLLLTKKHTQSII